MKEQTNKLTIKTLFEFKNVQANQNSKESTNPTITTLTLPTTIGLSNFKNNRTRRSRSLQNLVSP